MVDPQTSFILNTVGLLIEILGAWSVYASMPRWEDCFGRNLGDQRFYIQTRRGYFNLGLFLTIGLLMQYIARL